MRRAYDTIGLAVLAPSRHKSYLADLLGTPEDDPDPTPSQPQRHLRLLPRLHDASRRHSASSLIIVDDDTTTCDTLAPFLRQRGFHVWIAENATIALALVAHYAPDLVITELSLPGMKGGDLIRALRRQRATMLLPIIILSAVATPRDIRSGLAIGADDFIAKPADLGIVEARIAALLRRDSRLRRSLTSVATEEMPWPVLMPLPIK